jgi:type VI secretion system protein
MRDLTARIACIVLALAAFSGCGTIANLLPGHQKTTSLSSLRVAAPPGANLNSAVLLDIVFVYDATSVAMLPKSGPEWFAQRAALLSGLGKNIDVVSLQVPPATVIDPVALPSKAGKAIAVYSFANYQAKDGQARSDITAYRHAVVWLAATQITVTEQ